MEDELEQLLAGFGNLESSGVFTLDVRKARVKLGRFHLPPGCWLASLVQAGVAAGCSAVQITSRRKATLVVFEEPAPDAFPLADLMKGLEEPLSLERDTPGAYLTAGILASGGRPLWTCLGGGQQEQLQWVDEEVACSQVAAEGAARAHLLMRDVEPDRATAAARCRYAPIPVMFNGERFPTGWERERCDEMGPEFRLGEQFWGPGSVGLPAPPDREARPALEVFMQEVVGQGPWDSGIQIPASLAGKQTVHWIRQGVWLHSDEVEMGVPGCVVVAAARGLNTDISQFKVVRDELYVARVAELRGRVQQLLRLIHGRRPEIEVTRRGRGAMETASSVFGGLQLAGIAAAVGIPEWGPLYLMGTMFGGLVLAGGAYVFVDHQLDSRERKRIVSRLEELCR